MATPNINLSRVSISLDQFQEVSSGELNIGEVRLSSEHTIRRVNNHALWKSLNKVSLSHEEVLAIKNAFVKTLSNSGVGADELNKIREELGLAPMKPIDKGFHERSMKPLSRQQIREILDRNAATINDHVGVGTIRHSNEIYAGVRPQTRTTRRAERDAVNAELPTRRSTVENRSITTLQSVLAGDVDFVPSDRRQEILETARQCLDNILGECHMKPRADHDGSVTWSLSADKKVVLSSGLTELALVRKLEEMIVRLSKDIESSEREFAAREEFKALGTPEARTTWAANLSNVQHGAQKARVVAVMIMHDRGITDAATLSVVNKLSNENAIAFVRDLIAEGMNLEGDELRQSNPVQTALASAEPDFEPDEFEDAYIPALTDQEYNEEIASCLNYYPEKLPTTYRYLVLETSATVRSRFGAAGYADNASASCNTTGTSTKALTGANDPAAPRITVDALRDRYMTAAINAGAKRLFEAGVKSRLDAAGLKVHNPPNVSYALSARCPDIMTRILSAQSPEEAGAVLDDYTEEIAECARRTISCERCNKTLAGWAREGMAAKLGVSVNSFSDEDFTTRNLRVKGNALSEAIGAGTNPANTDDEIEAEFKKLVDKFVNERVELIKKVDKLDIPPEPKDALRALVLKMDKLNYIDIDAIVAAAKKISTDKLFKCFSDKAPAVDIFNAMNEITAVATEEMTRIFDDALKQGKDIGPDETANIMAPIIMIAILSKPGLEPRLSEFLASNAVSGQDFYDDENPAHPAANFIDFLFKPGSNAALSAKLGTDTLPPDHAKALVAAAREEGYGELSVDDAIAMFSPGKYAGDMLKLFVETSETAIRATSFKLLARSALRSYKETIAKATQNMQTVGMLTQAFVLGKGAEQALAAGYAQAELPRIAKTFALYKVAMNVSDEDALAVALDPSSKASRLASCGGRFVESVANFVAGLELMKAYDAWFEKTFANAYSGKPTNTTERLLQTTVVVKDAAYALEEFLFDEIAINNNIPLDVRHPEKVFGMENNPAMRFVGRGYTTSFANSLAQISPVQRELIYAVFDALDPLPKEDVVDKKKLDHVSQSALLAARVMKNYDAVAALRDEGKLDREHLIPLLYADLNVAPTATNKEIDKAYTKLLFSDPLAGLAHMQMIASGTMIPETLDAMRQGQRLPNAPGISIFNGHLEGIDGTANEGRSTMVGDLIRPTGATIKSKGIPAIPADKAKFTVRFPDGTVLESKKDKDGNEDYKAATDIADKIESLCGKVHQKQLSSVYFALTQSSIGANVNGGFLQHDIDSNEHMGIVFTLEKNNETGDVKVSFSEPEGFPLHFSWETTIHLDGSSESTPMIVTK